MLDSISGTITPWILGTLLLLILLATAIVVKSWREMKGSPYYFMRLQAEKRLQTYSFVSMGLILFTAVFAGSVLQSPEDNTPLVAVLTNAKPASEEIQKLVQSAQSQADEVVPETELTLTPSVISTTSNDPFGIDAQELTQSVLTLPEEFDRFEPSADLTDDTALGEISFSTKLNDEYEAINPTNIFNVGSYTVYASFSYDGMADGMEWAWVWRHEGEVVEGGNELWKYGSDGPGYIYYNPEEGFRAGDYSLEVWVNGELLTRSTMTMTGSALSTGN